MAGEDFNGKTTIGASVPVEMVDAIDEIVRGSGGMYNNRSDFVRDTLREKILEFKNNR